MTNGLQARKEKIDETRGKIQDLNNKMKDTVIKEKSNKVIESLKDTFSEDQ